MCFPPKAALWTPVRAPSAAITWMKVVCRKRYAPRLAWPGSPNTSPAIPFGTYCHTTHRSSIFQVCYPYHPFFGQTVKLVRRLRQQTSDSVVIELPDGLEIAIPFWMLDPLACIQIKEART